MNLGKSEEALIRPGKHEQAMISRLNGLLEQLNGNYSSAIEEFLRAQQLHESRGQNKERVLVMNDLGLLHAVTHDMFAAELYLTNALNIAKEANLREETLICFRSLSRLKHDSGQSGEAQQINRRGLRLAHELNCERLIKEFANQLSMITPH